MWIHRDVGLEGHRSIEEQTELSSCGYFFVFVLGLAERLEVVDKVVRKTEVGEELSASDTGGFVDHGESATGVCSTADEVDTIEIFESIVWSQVQHLSQVMGEVEGSPAVDRVIITPLGGSDYFFVLDAAFEVTESDFFEPFQSQFPEGGCLFGVPRSGWTEMRNGDENIDSAFAGWGQA